MFSLRFYAVIIGLQLVASQGSWNLAGNINPCDGSNFGYGGPWNGYTSVGHTTTSLEADFLDTSVWSTPAQYITIARHEDGQCMMSKTWEFIDNQKSLADYFRNYPGQLYVTGDGSEARDQHISADMPEPVSAGDPIFGANGGLVFNWYYSNNGARIAVPGAYKIPYQLPTTENNDDVHGLGNEFGASTSAGSGSNSWWHDVGKMQGDCHGDVCEVVGTDHGTDLSDGECWGSYAIYISNDLDTFECQNHVLENVMEVRTEALCGVFSCGDDAMLKPLMNIEVGSSFGECCECSYAASNHAFLGMFMKGEFDNQSRKLSLSFDLPSDVQIQSIDWNGASDDTLSYASGLWTSSTVNQCRNTYVLNEGLSDIFGSGSLFSLSGTTLTTSIRVSATSEITQDGSTFERSYSEDIPILVGLETETTVQATFHMTMTEGELVHITGNAEHFATDGTVKLTMMVTTPGCIENTASIASGMQHLTDPEFTFGEANLVDNLCEQEVTLTFDPIEEFADQISIQFTSRQGVDFQIEVDVNIQAGSILDYLPFDAVMTFHAEPTFSDDPQAEFLLGAEVYAKIELSPLVNLPLSSITVNSFTLTQTGYSGELETTDLMNEGWAGFSYTTTPEQNQIAAEFELESTHFHVTEEGELCEVDTDISIVYQDGTTVRRQLSMRRRLTTQQVSNGFAIAEAVTSESMVAQILKRKTPAMKTFFIFAFFFTASILIFRAYAATKRDEYASLLSADYDEF